MTKIRLSRSTRNALIKERLKETLGPRGVTFIRKNLRNKSFFPQSFHDRRTIFIHIPKSAGTSLGEEIFGSGRTGHFEWTYYHAENPKAFASYFKFAFVRDPLLRFVSAYNYLIEGGKSETDRLAGEDLQKYGNINSFLQEGFYRDGWHRWVHFRTQTSFLYDTKDQKVDFVGRLENFDLDIKLLAKKLNMPLKSQKKNASKSVGFTVSDLSDQSLHKIYDIYENDYKNFQYKRASKH